MRTSLVLFAVSWLACAADWPRFRGPNGLGVGEPATLPTQFNPSSNVVWRTALPPGHSSPILSGDRIFLTAFEGDNLYTIALDRETGKVLWRRAAPRDRREAVDKRNSPASPSPAADGGNVSMNHLLHSTRRELQKMGRLVKEKDLTYE